MTIPLSPVRKKRRPTPSKGAGRREQLPLLLLIGQRIKAVRLKRGLSQDDLAIGIPADRSHLALIETGRASVTAMTLYKLAFALDCEVSSLLPSREEVRKALRKKPSAD